MTEISKAACRKKRGWGRVLLKGDPDFKQPHRRRQKPYEGENWRRLLHVTPTHLSTLTAPTLAPLRQDSGCPRGCRVFPHPTSLCDM